MVSIKEEISPVTERTRGSGCVEVHHRGGLNASIFEEDFIASVNRRNDSTRQTYLVCPEQRSENSLLPSKNEIFLREVIRRGELVEMTSIREFISSHLQPSSALDNNGMILYCCRSYPQQSTW